MGQPQGQLQPARTTMTPARPVTATPTHTPTQTQPLAPTQAYGVPGQVYFSFLSFSLSLFKLVILIFISGAGIAKPVPTVLKYVNLLFYFIFFFVWYLVCIC